MAQRRESRIRLADAESHTSHVKSAKHDAPQQKWPNKSAKSGTAPSTPSKASAGEEINEPATAARDGRQALHRPPVSSPTTTNWHLPPLHTVEALGQAADARTLSTGRPPRERTCSNPSRHTRANVLSGAVARDFNLPDREHAPR